MNPTILKILIIIPAFNESGNISRTIKEIRGVLLSGVDVLVINDGSTDATANEARDAGAKVLSLPFNLGIGGAVQTGFRYAHEHGYDIAIQVDGDGQHDASYVPQLIAPIANACADMVIGSRFMAEGGFKSTFSRRIGINFFVHLINVLTGVKVSDPTSGFRAFNRRLIELFARYYPSDFPEPEAVVVAQQAGAVIVEVPVVMRRREAGNSSIRYFKSLYYMIKVTLAIVLHMIRQGRP
jgi:glycosyltransferase involved in cell wall biosynthesis